MQHLERFDVDKINENFRQLENWLEYFENGFRLRDGGLFYTKGGLQFQMREA